MSMRAFYLEPQKWGSSIVLEGPEAAHANVVRLKTGEKVAVLDGEGRLAICRVGEALRKKIILEMEEEKIVAPPAAKAIIALALSKAVRRGFFMEKASELGAWEIWLWRAERSQGKLSQDLGSACRGQFVAGMKQCLNPWLPKIHVLDDVASVAQASREANWKIVPWEEQTGVPMLAPDQLGQPGITVYVIGPEGGFTPSEIGCLRENHFTPASLGNRVLRCETAASLCLGLHWWAAGLHSANALRQ